MSTQAPNQEEARIELIDKAEDITAAFDCVVATFGHQIHDGIWTAINPGWDTPEGKARGAARMVSRFQSVTTNKQGNPNTLFLKATLPDPARPEQRLIVGLAIWAQLSAVEGHGDVPSTDLRKSADVEGLYPGNEPEQRYICQVYASLLKQRVEYVAQKASADQPAILVLDLCVVDPAFQRRGIAGKLVQWGLDEAKRRGGLEATTEASSMGRHVYARLGFRKGQDVEYVVDEEFAERSKPPNVFMRTGADE